MGDRSVPRIRPDSANGVNEISRIIREKLFTRKNTGQEPRVLGSQLLVIWGLRMVARGANGDRGKWNGERSKVERRKVNGAGGSRAT
jgi:hypothetical protein